MLGAVVVVLVGRAAVLGVVQAHVLVRLYVGRSVSQSVTTTLLAGSSWTTHTLLFTKSELASAPRTRAARSLASPIACYVLTYCS